MKTIQGTLIIDDQEVGLPMDHCKYVSENCDPDSGEPLAMSLFSGATSGAVRGTVAIVDIESTRESMAAITKASDEQQVLDAQALARCATPLQRKALTLAQSLNDHLRLHKIVKAAYDYAVDNGESVENGVNLALQTYISLYGTPEINDISRTASRRRDTLMRKMKRKAQKRARRR